MEPESQPFRGKTVFVTGGGTGLGLACARRVVAGGGRAVLGGRREDVVRAAAAALGDAALGVVCDVTNDASVAAAVERAVAHGDGLQLAVNSAGTGSIGNVLNSTAEEFAGVLDTNLTGVFRALRHEAKAMRAGGGGSIVNVSSIAAVRTHRWWDAYCASKAGVNMLTQCAADDLGEYGIRVNAVMPGLVPTDLAAPLAGAPPVVEEYLRRMPVSRLGTPEDVSALAAFLLSDAAGWVTGQCIAVDGGHTLRQGPDVVDLLKAMMPEEN